MYTILLLILLFLFNTCLIKSGSILKQDTLTYLLVALTCFKKSLCCQ